MAGDHGALVRWAILHGSPLANQHGTLLFSFFAFPPPDFNVPKRPYCIGLGNSASRTVDLLVAAPPSPSATMILLRAPCDAVNHFPQLEAHLAR
jgi:hypothetical protein